MIIVPLKNISRKYDKRAKRSIRNGRIVDLHIIKSLRFNNGTQTFSRKPTKCNLKIDAEIYSKHSDVRKLTHFKRALDSPYTSRE